MTSRRRKIFKIFPLLLVMTGVLGACEGSGVSTSFGFGGGPGLGIGPGGYGAYGGYGGSGFGLTFPSSSGGAMASSVPDQQVIDATVQHALEFKPTGEAAGWANPSTGNSGVVTPTRTYQNAHGQTCRDFQQTTGQKSPVTGSACRDAAGVWQAGAG